MNIACGVDIIHIPGIQNIIRDESMLKEFFDPSEMQPSTPEHLAGVIAAKEAFFKALGLKPKFRDVQITYQKSGKPQLNVTPAFRMFSACDVSISHDNDYAVAFVVLQK